MQNQLLFCQGGLNQFFTAFSNCPGQAQLCRLIALKQGLNVGIIANLDVTSGPRATPRCFLWSLWQVIFGTWSELLILSNELYWAHRHWLGSCSHSLSRCCLLDCRSLTRWPSESGVCCEQQSVGLRLFDLLKRRWDVCSQTLWEIMYYGAFFPL